MCSIGRSFVSALPSRTYQPTAPEFRELVAIYLGAPSPLAAALGIGRPVRSARRAQSTQLLDPWGFALTATFEPAGQSVGSWRVHHDALVHLFYGDAIRAGVTTVAPSRMRSSPTCFLPLLAVAALAATTSGARTFTILKSSTCARVATRRSACCRPRLRSVQTCVPLRCTVAMAHTETLGASL